MDKISDIIKTRKSAKPPAHEWQDLALRVVAELKIPAFKRGAVFDACKKHPKQEILNALNDTKELCRSKDKWKYFFKIIGNAPKRS